MKNKTYGYTARKKRRDRLFELNPNCPFCSVLMVHPKDCDQTKTLPSNMLTVEHLYSKYNPEREKVYAEHKMFVTIICCQKCNQKRGIQDRKKYAKKLG